MSKKKFWLTAGVITIVVFLIILVGYSMIWDRLELVQKGLANPKFPYTKYSQKDLEKIYPSHEGNANVATTRSPEETHKMFVEKLKEGDLDGAVECCMVERIRSDWGGWLKELQQQDKINLMISDIDEIEQEMMLDTIATYFYVVEVDGEKYANTIEFQKDKNGVWLIESL